MTGFIYSAYNNKSSKTYIGQTTRKKLEYRITEHYYEVKQNRCKSKFKFALNKYQNQDWEWNILIEVDVDLLNYYEEKFISLFDTLNNGYNTTKGGEGFKGCTHKLESKLKMSESAPKEKPWLKKEIEMLDYKTKELIQAFESTNKAAEMLKINRAAICNNLNGLSKKVINKKNTVFFNYKK